MNELISRITVALNKAGKEGMSFKALLKKLKIRDKDFRLYIKTIDKMKATGDIFEKRDSIVLTKHLKLIPAKITRVNKTFGFAQTIEDEIEYFIPGKFLLGSLPNDMVLIRKIDARGDSPEGQVMKITEMADGEFTGKLFEERGQFFIEPDSLAKTPIGVKKMNLGEAKSGDKVLAKITYRGERHSDHKAEIIMSYGDAQTAESCANAIIDLAGVVQEFNFEILDKARFLEKRGITSKDFMDRADFRNDTIFTIDSAESKDLDDAIGLTKLEDCYILGVHIADVSHYVKYQSAIDQEAYYRGTSIYYADKVIPMLPKELSNGICSLSPNEDRLTLSAILTLDLEGNIIDFDFTKSIINSKVKGVYTEINSILKGEETPDIAEKYKSVRKNILEMKELADILTANKKKRGAPELETNESKIILNDEGITVDIKARQSGMSETLIEEFMLLANEATAMAMKMKNLPCIYRVHEPPTDEKLEKLNKTLKVLRLTSRSLSSNVKPKALAEILEKVRGENIHSVVNLQVLRSMSKAKYSEAPLGHYGLALENYAHFTSPIRRYPDLFVHRVLSEYLAGTPEKQLTKKYAKYAVKSAKQSSQAEINAMKIERDCEDCYKAEYMKNHLGEEFEGIISSVANHGLYVELPNTIEGLVRPEDLGSGEMFFDEVMSFKNMTTGETYTIGDTMKIQCVKADVNSGKIDFKPVK